MNLYFWQNIPSIHQSDLISEVAKIWDGSVFVITESNIPSERRKQGWHMPNYSPATLIINPEEKEIINIVNKTSKKDVHVFSGIGSYNKTQKILDLVVESGSIVGVYAELPRGNEGVKSFLRKIKYKYLAFKYKNQIDFLLLTGNKAVDYFHKSGFKKNTLFDFGYFIASNALSENNYELKINDNKLRLLYIGSLIDRKGIDLLFEAIFKLPQHYYLDIIGCGKLKKKLIKLANKLSIENRLIWHGNIENTKIHQYINNADYLILPSRFDGWGVVVNEALVLGTPVIVSDDCGASDLIVSNLQGSIFQSGSVTSLHNKLLALKKTTLMQRNQLKIWSINSIHPDVVASYLISIIKASYPLKSQLLAPWKEVTRSNEVRKIILVFIAYYLPSYKSGGPVRTIENLVKYLGGEFDFKIVCGDRDSFETSAYTNTRLNTWSKVGKASVFYTSPENQNIGYWKEIINSTSHNIIYLNSFFSIKFSIFPLIANKILRNKKIMITAPRGEFSKDALSIKPLKKKILIFSYKFFGLSKNIIWQASSSHELEEIRNIMGIDCQTHIAIDLPEFPQEIPPPPFFSKKLRVIFISRISRIKNLDLVLRIISKSHCEIIFDIYGFIGDQEYWNECLELMTLMPSNVHVKYIGLVSRDEIFNTFSKYDLFILPSKSENYGHVIAESLAVGTPVLISDRTPWKNLEKRKLGWDLPIDSADTEKLFLNALKKTYQINFEDKVKWRNYIISCSKELLINKKDINKNRLLFKNI